MMDIDSKIKNLVICSLWTELICVHIELAVENFLWQF